VLKRQGVCDRRETEDPVRRGKKIMTMFQDVDAEQLARLYYHYHEALAPESEKQANDKSSTWESTPQPERRRMVAAARLALLELAAPAVPKKRKYYATPGEADWGC